MKKKFKDVTKKCWKLILYTMCYSRYFVYHHPYRCFDTSTWVKRKEKRNCNNQWKTEWGLDSQHVSPKENWCIHRSCTLVDSSLSVSLKLTSLHDYYQRLLHGSQPVPSGLDMANTLKFFSQMLLCKNFDIYIYYIIHLNSVQRNNFILPIHFLSSPVERGTGSTSRNGEIAKVRRGTDGPLPQPGLQTIVQRPHPADRRRFLHSHRAARL